MATNGSGSVLTTQRFDPWGKVIAGGITQTRRNFTGQYLDETGLLYYNARYYDPGLGRFISADTISPGKTNPQNRNRYSYALNNPLRWIDPSGHCVEDYDRTVAGCKQYLNNHGWTNIDGDWAYNELALFVSSIQDLKRAMGWLGADYRSAMTGGGTHSLRLVMHDRSPAYDPNRTAQTTSGAEIVVDVFRENAFYTYEEVAKILRRSRALSFTNKPMFGMLRPVADYPKDWRHRLMGYG